MSPDDVVMVEDLTVTFGDFHAVKNVSFTVKKGEIFGFLGANGAGKTTTIRVICGLQRPSSGSVTVCGEQLVHDNVGSVDRIKSLVGYMSQKFTLYNDLSVGENLQFASHLRKLSKSAFNKTKQDLYKFIQFQQAENTLVNNLSGGIKQQISLVASLLHHPQVIFLDEPTAGVSPASRARFWNLIRDLSKSGTTVFVTTHYMDEAEQCDRIALMRSGELIALDTPAQLNINAFPLGVWEATTKDASQPPQNSQALKQQSGATYIETYGRRFHIAFQDENSSKKGLAILRESYDLSLAKPNLEDVFLKMVE